MTFKRCAHFYRPCGCQAPPASSCGRQGHRVVAPRSEADLRTLLIVPVAVAILTVWIAAGVRAVLEGDVQPFLIATGPLSVVAGYVMGMRLVRKDETGG